MKKYLVGIDCGGTETKAALFDTSGNEIAVATRTVLNFQPYSGWNERDAEVMWSQTCEVIREVLNKSNIKSEEIVGIACTGHGNGLYLIDAKGKTVRNGINSTDTRAQNYIDQWVKAGVDKQVLSYTAQSLWPGQPNAILAWLMEYEPKTLKKAKWVLMAKDFIRMKLTGEIFAEITDMSGTSLMNIFHGNYDVKVLEFFKLEEIIDLLPPLIGSSDLGGKITKEAALLTGLKEGTLVAGGMFDIDACALASGIVDESQMSLVVGTWGNNQYIAKEPLFDADLFMCSIYSIPGWYLMLEGSPTSAGNLDWFIKTFLSYEKEHNPKQFFEWLNSQVESVAPNDAEVIFLPYLYGCNVPRKLPAVFYGLNSSHTRSHLIRAVFEGVVFSHKTHVDRLLNVRRNPEIVRISGGAAQSPIWMQLFADVIGLPVEVPMSTQLGAHGAAIAASVCSNVYQTFEEAIQNMTKFSQKYIPNEGLVEVYVDRYHKYKELIENLS